MYFQRFYDEYLAQASYFIGCQETGTAIVIDPARNIEPYLDVAKSEGLLITAVAETHIHADFVSGLRELAAATDATMYISGCGTAEWQYAFRDQPRVQVLSDQDTISVGNIRIQAVHAPGHTPEHLVFLVTDGAATDDPIGVVTGDLVFVGDVGRPDLLEKAAKVANTAAASARQLYASLQWFKTLPDHLQVWPGHGAGSACGKGIGSMPQSTVGYERRNNWALADFSKDEFVAEVLAGQPDPPAYFGRMKRVNREGPPILGRRAEPSIAPSSKIMDLSPPVDVLVDTRSTSAYSVCHVMGSINVPRTRSFVTYAGSALPYDRKINVILRSGTVEQAEAVVTGLLSIGFDDIGWIFSPDALEIWKHAGRPTKALESVAAGAAARSGTSDYFVIDVRNRSEWEAGHIPGATLIPLPEIQSRIDEIPLDRRALVACQTGSRSAVAASILGATGRAVTNMVGGFSAWLAGGGKVEK